MRLASRLSPLLLCSLVACQYTTSYPGPFPEDDVPWLPPDPGVGAPEGAAVSGGTLLISRDDRHAVVADPDRDHIYSVDLATREVVLDLALAPGAEPGRLAEDRAGRIHVATRRGGDVVTLASPTGPVAFTRHVCAEARGIAYDGGSDVIHVACTDGSLVSLPAAGGGAVRTLQLDRDLRDVVVLADGSLRVTRFKTAEVLSLDARGTVVGRERSPDVNRITFTPDSGELLEVPSVAAVGWRAVAMPGGAGLVMAHQRARRSVLGTDPGGYGGGDMCGGGPVESTASLFVPGQPVRPGKSLNFTTLPVDLAVSHDGQHMALAMAGDNSVRVVRTSNMLEGGEGMPCEQPPPEENYIFEGVGIPTSVGWTDLGELVVFYPDQLRLSVYTSPTTSNSGWTAVIPGRPIDDPGRQIYHQMAGAGLACASCHPEGREDGMTWEFRGLGVRRTQNVGGHILARAPYHWDGDMVDLARLMEEVFVGRMGGQFLASWQVKALGNWLDTIPAPAPTETVDAAAVARGRAIFVSAEVGCTQCHNGPLFTNNRRYDVGTGGMFKVPSLLGIGARAPFLHTGCAGTLRDRFSCGGGDLHGKTSGLSEAELGDLVAYLESL